MIRKTKTMERKKISSITCDDMHSGRGNFYEICVRLVCSDTNKETNAIVLSIYHEQPLQDTIQALRDLANQLEDLV